MELNENLQNAGANVLNAKATEIRVDIFFSIICLGIFVIGTIYLIFGKLPITLHIFNM